MKVLFIGGTGTISMAITRLLAQQGHELFLLNRGSRADELPENVTVLKADINDEAEINKLIGDMSFDAVGEFIGFVPSQDKAVHLYQLCFCLSEAAVRLRDN